MVEQVEDQANMLGKRRPSLRPRVIVSAGEHVDHACQVPTQRGMEYPVHELHISSHGDLPTNRLFTLLAGCHVRTGEIAR
jgi:hypothetical protein